jgi:PilZ domain
MSYSDERGRVSTRMAGALIGEGRRSVIAIRNLSVGGAMVEMASPPAEGSRVRFESPATGGLDARVVWVIGNRCGLMFNRAVLPDFSDVVTQGGKRP